MVDQGICTVRFGRTLAIALHQRRAINASFIDGILYCGRLEDRQPPMRCCVWIPLCAKCNRINKPSNLRFHLTVNVAYLLAFFAHLLKFTYMAQYHVTGLHTFTLVSPR
ncbi:hypothetical protein SUGI_0255880 [Cryptomeria japonica]|nr:hypothetical protein SUGI_0255880 [Cryptomeria japonica]